jgi:peptidoglycan-N-acetylglucosamine deacetylase
MISALDRDLAELQEAAGAYAARHQRIADFGYPPGVRIAVNITLDFDSMLLRRLLNEPPMQLAKGEFGGRVGIWRLIELFDAHKVKATIFTPGRACELYPQAIRAAVESGHEIADHMWEHRVPKEAALEEDHLGKTVAAIEEISGRRPVGTRSGHSAALLRKYGYI